MPRSCDYRHGDLHGPDHRNCGNHDEDRHRSYQQRAGLHPKPEEANLLTTDSSSQNASSGTSYDLSKITDGTYKGTASVADNGDAENEDEFAGYDVSVEVSVSGHKITAVTVSQDGVPSESTSYIKKAINGTKRLWRPHADSRRAVHRCGRGVQRNIFFQRHQGRRGQCPAGRLRRTEPLHPATDEYTYGYAALTWAEYWANEGVYNAGSAASSDKLDSRKETDKGAFDVVTRATANHGLHRGSYQCTAVIQAEDGTEFNLATWAADGKSFTTTDGKTVAWNRGEMTVDGKTYKMKDYEVTGLKYVPVKVKTADLDAFKQTHAFVANGETLAGGYGEANLKAYSGLVADVDASTHGLKTVTMNGTTASFSAADETGTGSVSRARRSRLPTSPP